jgi:hypothetical protein
MCQVCCISDENCHIDVVRPQMSRFLLPEVVCKGNKQFIIIFIIVSRFVLVLSVDK